jgi:starvation-inducible DNA-binding protein
MFHNIPYANLGTRDCPSRLTHAKALFRCRLIPCQLKHLLLDEQADQIEKSVDILAERVRKVGGTTIRSIGHIAKLQRIEDNDADFVAPRDMLLELMDDNKSQIENMRNAHKLVDDHEDVATASRLEIFIDEAEKRCWFLFEASRQTD